MQGGAPNTIPQGPVPGQGAQGARPGSQGPVPRPVLRPLYYLLTQRQEEPVSTLSFWTRESGCRRRGTTDWTLTQGTHGLLHKLAPALPGFATEQTLSLNLQKATPWLYQASCFKMVGDMVRLVNSRSRRPWPPFFGGEGVPWLELVCVEPHDRERGVRSLDPRMVLVEP